jgi:hypothetical protein
MALRRKTSIAVLVASSVLVMAPVAWAGPARQGAQTVRETAPARAMFPRPCSKVTVAGYKWSIVVSNFRCAAAADIVRRLASKKVPPKRAPYKGTFSGVRCEGGPIPGKPPKSIICGKKKTGFPAVSAFRGV